MKKVAGALQWESAVALLIAYLPSFIPQINGSQEDGSLRPWCKC